MKCCDAMVLLSMLGTATWAQPPGGWEYAETGPDTWVSSAESREPAAVRNGYHDPGWWKKPRGKDLGVRPCRQGSAVRLADGHTLITDSGARPAPSLASSS